MSKIPSKSISVIVPQNPFTPVALQDRKHCLCALDVEKLMEWWPGTPHSPHRDSQKVYAIQRSLDWKRVAKIAAYLLQQEIIDAPDLIDKYFKGIYTPKRNEPGRVWPPKVSRVIGFQPSEFPTFSNVLLHVNGAKIDKVTIPKHKDDNAGRLTFNERSKALNFTVIDGQHRINGAYLAVKILQEVKNKKVTWQIPAEIFLDLDKPDMPPSKQAQIFIDVNYYQKRVDKSLVADLFPTARGPRESKDNKERAQDIGRKLMLEIGPLVGMIQIPGIRYGVKDVVSLATLNDAIESELDILFNNGIVSLDEQTEFFAQCLQAWFEASGRFEKIDKNNGLDPENVVYQGRILVSMLTLIPAFLWNLKSAKMHFISEDSLNKSIKWLKQIMSNSRLMENNSFISKSKFKELGFLGSGGIGRFRDVLWASVIGSKKVNLKKIDQIAKIAEDNKRTVYSKIIKP